MIVNYLVEFLNKKLVVYTEYQNKVVFDQFGVLELDLVDVDENCENWIGTLFLHTNRNMPNPIKTHYKMIKELLMYCKFEGSIVSDNYVINIYPPQINIAGMTDDYYVHTIAMTIHKYEREV